MNSGAGNATSARHLQEISSAGSRSPQNDIFPNRRSREKCGSARLLHRVGTLAHYRSHARRTQSPSEGGCRFGPVFMRLSATSGFDCTAKRRAGRERSFHPAAQNFMHGLVDELHSIENTADRVPPVCLTLFPVAVQQHRSLTVSQVFPVGGESGAQASSLRPSTDLEVHSESGDGGCRNLGTAVPGEEGASPWNPLSARRCW